MFDELLAKAVPRAKPPDRLGLLVSREVWSAASARRLSRRRPRKAPREPEPPAPPPLRPDHVAGGAVRRGRAAHRDRRRRPAARGRRGGAGLGELPVARGLLVAARRQVGPHALHLDLTLGQWAADGLLALFFFVAGLELKREFLVGELRTPAKAALPVAAALCGVALPAIVYAVTVTVLGADGGCVAGLGDPDGDRHRVRPRGARGHRHPPASALRSFLLTLAVVDDLVAITIIAIFYTESLDLAMLGLALLPLAGFAWLVQRRIARWWLLRAAGRAHLGPGPRLGDPRDRGGRAARSRRAGAGRARRCPG